VIGPRALRHLTARSCSPPGRAATCSPATTRLAVGHTIERK